MKRHITYFDARRPLIAKSTLSSTESFGKRLVTWNVRAMPSAVRRWLGQRVTSWPNSSTRPDDAGRMPVIRLNSVVLPAPFGPMMALRSPGMILSDTPRTARSPPKVFDRSFSSSTGPPLLLRWWLTRKSAPEIQTCHPYSSPFQGEETGRPLSLHYLPRKGGGSTWRACQRSPRLFAILAGREVAAVDRLLEERILAVCPELADVRISLDHDVPELWLVVTEQLRLLDLLDVDVLYWIAHLVEADRPAHRVDLERR